MPFRDIKQFDAETLRSMTPSVRCGVPPAGCWRKRKSRSCRRDHPARVDGRARSGKAVLAGDRSARRQRPV